MQVIANQSLKPYNTMRLDVKAKYFVEVINEAELLQVIQDRHVKKLPKLILGGGSNLVLTQDFPGIAIKIAISGKQIIQESNNHVIVELGAGENWHQIVTWAVGHNWGGIENLALIPGTVGAAPVQNIGAYGQNLVDTFDSLTAVAIATGEQVIFNPEECQFGYRESIFKHQYRGQYIITRVRLRLTKQHALETSYFSLWTKYESIEAELQQISQPPYTIKDVFQAVINIRQRQLPDPWKVPTAGSFFKNPLVPRSALESLQAQIPELQFYPPDQLSYKQLTDPTFHQSEFVKLPAGRLLDHLGWKGKQVGHVSTFPKHALIVTHDGQATGLEVLTYMQAMQQDVKTQLDIDLEPEVVVV